MGQCQSANKNKLNNSFPDDYLVIETEEYSLDNENYSIHFKSLIERLPDDTIIQTQIKDGKIKKQKFKEKRQN